MKILLCGPMPLSALEKKISFKSFKQVIFVDGGIRHGAKAEVKKAIWVGDGDSANNVPENIKAKIGLSPEKDFSDLAFALSYCARTFPNATQLQLVGFSGGRFDHELAVLGEIDACLGKFAVRLTWPDKELICLPAGNWKWSYRKKLTWSLLQLKSSKVSIQGDCLYHLDPAKKLNPLSSHGLSNQCSKARGMIRLGSITPLHLIINNHNLSSAAAHSFDRE